MASLVVVGSGTHTRLEFLPRTVLGRDQHPEAAFLGDDEEALQLACVGVPMPWTVVEVLGGASWCMITGVVGGRSLPLCFFDLDEAVIRVGVGGVVDHVGLVDGAAQRRWRTSVIRAGKAWGADGVLWRAYVCSSVGQ